MAIVRKSHEELRREKPTIDRTKIDVTTEEEICRQMIEDGEDRDAPLEIFQLILPPHRLRDRDGHHEAVSPAPIVRRRG
jgi:putative transcriptional regulator